MCEPGRRSHASWSTKKFGDGVTVLQNGSATQTTSSVNGPPRSAL